jgi:hypothetical protein
MSSQEVTNYDKIVNLNKDVQKLVDAIKKNSTVHQGVDSVGPDGVKYRWDHYYFNYKSALNFLVNMFEKHAGTSRRFYIPELNLSIAYDRPTFKGEPNGKFKMAELIEYGPL